MKQVIGYTRVSTRSQKTSLENQKKRIEEYCKKNKYKIVEIYEDFGRSGKDTKGRPSFLNMMKYIEASEGIDFLIVTKLGRAFRSVGDMVQQMKVLKDKDIQFMSLGDNIDTTTAQGRFFLNIVASVYEFEREIRNEAREEGVKRAKAMGKQCHRPKKVVDLKALRVDYLKGVKKESLCLIYKVSMPVLNDRLLENGCEKLIGEGDHKKRVRALDRYGEPIEY